MSAGPVETKGEPLAQFVPACSRRSKLSRGLIGLSSERAIDYL